MSFHLLIEFVKYEEGKSFQFFNNIWNNLLISNFWQIIYVYSNIICYMSIIISFQRYRYIRSNWFFFLFFIKKKQKPQSEYNCGLNFRCLRLYRIEFKQYFVHIRLENRSEKYIPYSFITFAHVKYCRFRYTFTLCKLYKIRFTLSI